MIAPPPLRARARQGVMLFAVIVVLAVAALAVGALNVAQEAEHAGQVAANDQTQQRATAWSGAQAVAAALAEQRDRIALGEQPDLPAEMVLWEAEGRTAVVRLLPVGPSGELAASEAAKRALATVTASELALTGVVGDTAAGAVLARRSGCDSIEGLVDSSAGLPPALVLGPAVSTIADAVRGAQKGERAQGEGASRPLAIADVLTTFDAQRALGEVGPQGPVPRAVLAGEWTPEAMAAIDQQSTAGIAQRVRDALENRVPAHEGELVAALAKAKVEPAYWSGVLDAVVCNEAAIEVARVDLGRAPEAVLRSLPGVSAEKAARLVQERESLDASERMKLAWPVTHGVLTPEEFALLAPHITARSWLWKLRIVTGVVDAVAERDALDGAQVWDMVIDLSESPPRFASLRDSTLLPVAVGLAAQAAREPEVDERTPRWRRARGEAEDRAMDSARDAATNDDAAGRNPAPSDAVDGDGNGPEAEAGFEPATSLDGASAKKDRRMQGERLRDEREARQRAEEERRAANRSRSSASADAVARERAARSEQAWPRTSSERATDVAREFGADAPGATSSEGASSTGGSGRSASGAPTATTPTGGLSGRWRTRGTH